MNISKRKLVSIGESLKSCPFARGHSSYTFTINFTFDVRDWRKISEPIVNDKITLLTHAATHNGTCRVVKIAYHITKSIPFG